MENLRFRSVFFERQKVSFCCYMREYKLREPLLSDDWLFCERRLQNLTKWPILGRYMHATRYSTVIPMRL
jgi:hypothetical protein